MLITFEIKSDVRKAYHQALQKHPQWLLQDAATLQHARQKLDMFPNPIQAIDYILSFFRTKHIDFAQEISERRLLKLHQGPGDPEKINHYRDVWYTDSESFEARLYKSGTSAQLEFCGLGKAVKDIEGMTLRPLEDHPEFNAPRVIIKTHPRASYATTLKHEDSHAFSMGLDSPEDIYGIWLPDDGQGDMLARYYIDEIIARLEAGEPLHRGAITLGCYCGDRRGYNRMEQMIKTADYAILNARSNICDADLAYILRVLPAQEMKKALPRVVSAYKSQGMPLPNIVSNP